MSSLPFLPSNRKAVSARALAFAALTSAVLLSPRAHAEDLKPECATLLEKASGFARFDATYPQARADLKECATGQCTGNRALVEVCKQTLQKLDDTVPIYVRIKADAAARDGAQLTIDGTAPLKPTLQGNTAYRVKAGRHTVLVKAEGYQDATVTVDVTADSDDAARRVEITLVRLGKPAALSAAPTASASPSSDSSSDAGTPDTADSASSASSSSFPYRPVAVVVGAVGVVGLGVGTALGISALSKKSDAACNGDACPTDAQTNLLLSAKNTGNLSTIFMVAGGVLVAGGVVLWLLKPSEHKTEARLAPTFGPDGLGLVARGTF